VVKNDSAVVQSTASELVIFRLGLATLLATILLGGSLLVSANAKIPVVAVQQPLLIISGKAVRAAEANESALKIELSSEQLKSNALERLRSMPAYYSQASVINRSPLIHQTLIRPTESIDVNAFLLSSQLNNQSQLAELQMQPTFAEFDSQAFMADVTDLDLSSGATQVGLYHGVGFPHIEANNRPDSVRYKPYKQLLSISDSGNGQIVPHIKCMGLSPESVARRAEKYDQQIFELAVKYNVSASLVKAVVAKESCYNSEARSHVGAIGLMQLMPETAKWLKVSNPNNPQQNLAAGIRYLAQLRKRFGSNELALAAYNAGPGNVERYNGIPPFAETEQYVHDVMYFYRGYVATTRFINAQNAI